MTGAGSRRGVFVLGVAAALSASCGSDPAPIPVPFGADECRGQLVEMARFTETYPLIDSIGLSNTLAIDGNSLFFAYEFAAPFALPTNELSPSGGIVAIPLSGGAPRLVAAADPERTSEWFTGSFWADGGQIFLQTTETLSSVPANPPTVSTLPLVIPNGGPYAAYAHDAGFGYVAHDEFSQGTIVAKAPIDGGPATTLVQEGLPNVALAAMADAGDAVLLQLSWPADATPSGENPGRVWRIPKDGSPTSDVRPDLPWSDPLAFPQWLAWDGENVLGAIVVQNHIVMARVAPTGTTPPQLMKLYGTVATRRGGEILSLQPLSQDGDRLVVASSNGNPAGSVVACSPEGGSTFLSPAGIAANDDDIYVAYRDRNDTVIARVTP